MKVRATAPAKINWTLEVLGRRPDGYHEVRTVLQTIDLCDYVTLEEANRLSVRVTGAHSATEDDHTLQASHRLGQALRREFTVAIHVDKQIPVSAGLGGGSSDAGAVLRGLRALHSLDLDASAMAGVAASIGSDVPFFLLGGTALATGRGEEIHPLPDAPEVWLVVLVPPVELADKTRQVYARLEPRDFTDGERTARLAEKLRGGGTPRTSDVFSAFDRVASRLFAGLEGYRLALEAASGTGVRMAGAGPAIFSLHASQSEADGVAARLQGGRGRVFVARTMGAAEATRILS